MNRLQILYFVLIMPMYLTFPYMIGGIIAVGLLSQLNLVILSKWFASVYSTRGYEGFVQLFGAKAVRVLACLGLCILLIKITVITLGYVDVLHQFIFPSMSKIWLLLFSFLMGCYLALQGMDNMIRFVIIIFLGTVWITVLFLPVFSLPSVSIHNLYPLIPYDWSMHSWKSLLMMFSALSGPEYLIFLAPWLHPQKQTLSSLTWANAGTVIEHLFLFIISLLFYGSSYLSRISFPIVNISRYLQSPVFERVDVILLSIHMAAFVYALALFLLICYGATRITLGNVHKPTTLIGFLLTPLLIFLWLALASHYWDGAFGIKLWTELQIWLGASTYALIPTVLLIAVKRNKGRA
ncbi:GerAB/ArcD/ProY family transporter [Paenibacillus sp. S3N08]|uniref:GerAB/ArcD/ProY family transporter n=2 Tax=Paenibacillus agricola TaxID=2716264 RepID=A0ABX0J6V0_9BACL|nr:GerAB/ArcD/ProY family transporter [Paenibacillus agricola]